MTDQSPTTTPVVPPSTVQRLAGLRLASPRRVVGSRDGAHRSTRLGTSLEFADRRAYMPGDDPRTLDIAATRRSGRLLVRQHEAIDELSLRVVVDVSASMCHDRKAATAVQLSLALAHLAGHGGDRIRVLAAGPHHVTASGWARGRAAPLLVTRMWDGIDLAAPDADATPGPARLADAVHRARAEGPRGPVVLVSDLLVADWAKVVTALGTGAGGAVLVHVLSSDDRTLDATGDLELVDAETGAVVEVSVTPDVQRAHAERVTAWTREATDHAARHGIPAIALDPADDLADVVLSRLRRTGLVA